ncbi:MAG TPA: ABC transporter permease [Vicinamibacterales bacterium]|jgi:ABC-2 type transport system permease protein|nr:ABC transporter permease [Vicinamibacterales bacterium]
MRGLLGLTWLEIKIFVREPMGVLGTVGVPVLIFTVMARLVSRRGGGARDVPTFITGDLPILGVMFIIATTVLSLVTIIAIYREGGILKRLRATPLRPPTILTAHVLVKLVFTALTVVLMILVGRRYNVGADRVPILSFGLALLFCTTAIVSLGFLIASIVPTARFAQPIGTVIIYPLIGMSGIFFPVEALPAALQVFARSMPFMYAVSLMRDVWHGEGWSAHGTDVAAMTVMFAVFTAVSAKVFRWE